MKVDLLKASIRCSCGGEVHQETKNDQSNSACFVPAPMQCSKCNNRFFIHVQEVKKGDK